MTSTGLPRKLPRHPSAPVGSQLEARLPSGPLPAGAPLPSRSSPSPLLRAPGLRPRLGSRSGIRGAAVEALREPRASNFGRDFPSAPALAARVKLGEQPAAVSPLDPLPPKPSYCIMNLPAPGGTKRRETPRNSLRARGRSARLSGTGGPAVPGAGRAGGRGALRGVASALFMSSSPYLLS